MKKTVYVHHKTKAIEEMFQEFGWKIVNRIENAAFVQFTNGPDIHPSYFESTEHKDCRYDKGRDKSDVTILQKAKKLNKKLLGFERGALFLNVHNGGSLYHYCDNHDKSHVVIDLLNNQKVYAPSNHRQMMIPTRGAKILGVAFESTFKDTKNKNKIYRQTKGLWPDIEVIYYQKTKSLCFTPSPFYISSYKCKRMYFNMIEHCFGDK